MNEKIIDELFLKFRDEKDIYTPSFLADFDQVLTNYFDGIYYQKTVLGIDVYKYSKMDLVSQSLIPYIFTKVYEHSVHLCLTHESLFFKDKDQAWFASHFIDTGDGGFQIFDNPFQALIFCIYFQTSIRIVNSGNIAPLALKVMKTPLTVRYVMTNDRIMDFRNRFYGPAIINNARFLSCDKLNRFILDENTYQWFLLNTNGIETLRCLTVADVKEHSSKYINADGKSVIIRNNDSDLGILSADVQQIENITIKEETHKVYSVHLQVGFNNLAFFNYKVVVSLGNLNTSGL